MDRRTVILGGIGAGIGFLSGCMGVDLPGGGGSASDGGGVSVPSGYEKQATVPNPKEGVTIVQYTGSGSPEDAVAAFKSAAKDAGWSEEGTVAVLEGEWSGAGLKKDDEVMVIHATESDGQVMVTVVRAPEEQAGSDGTGGTTDSSEETEPAESPPQSDVEGSDFDDVPRYPDSVRIEYWQQETDADLTIGIKYLTDASFEEIFNFYDEALPDQGWTVAQSTQSAEEGGFVATKDSKQVMIRWESNTSYDGYVDIEMVVVETK